MSLVATIVGSKFDLLSTGDKLLSVRNNDSERVAVDYLGHIIGTPAVDDGTHPALVLDTSSIITSDILSIRKAGFQVWNMDVNGANKTYGPITIGALGGSSFLTTATIFSVTGGGNVTLDLEGVVTDGASAVAVKVNSFVALVTAGAKLLSVQNNTVEKLSVDLNGVVGTPTGVQMKLLSGIANVGTNIAHILDTRVAFAGSTKLLSVRNNNVEKFSVNNAGNLTCGGIVASGLVSGSALNTGGNVTGSTLIATNGIFIQGGSVSTDTGVQFLFQAGPTQPGTPYTLTTSDAYPATQSLIDIGDSGGATASIFQDGTYSISGSGRLKVSTGTDTSVTPTINKPSGRVRIAAGANHVTLSNSLSTGTNKVLVQIVGTPDTTCFVIAVNYSTPGTIVFTGNGNATGNVDLDFFIVND